MSKANALSFGLEAINKGKEYIDNLGILNDEVVVTIRGNKLAKKADLYKMAAALAFGQVQRSTIGGGVIPSPGVIMMENHLHDICVTFTLRYSRSIANVMAAKAVQYISTSIAGGSPLTVQEYLNTLPVLTGPDNDYSGGNWDFSTILIKDKESLDLKSGANLPFANRPILYQSSHSPDPNPNIVVNYNTKIASQNPRPMSDARSRGTLVSLVTAALSNPGSVESLKMPLSSNVNVGTYTGGP